MPVRGLRSGRAWVLRPSNRQTQIIPIVITGVSSGVGRDAAEDLAMRGNQLAIVGRCSGRGAREDDCGYPSVSDFDGLWQMTSDGG